MEMTVRNPTLIPMARWEPLNRRGAQGEGIVPHHGGGGDKSVVLKLKKSMKV